MRRSVPVEIATFGGHSQGTEFVIEASLFDIGFALVTEVAIDGRETIACPTQIPRANTLDQAIDQGKAFAVSEIARTRDMSVQHPDDASTLEANPLQHVPAD